MTKSTDETTELPEEEISDAAVVTAETSDDDAFVEGDDIPDEEGKPVKKKMAALKARHKLEDYFEMKRIQNELDYLEEEKRRAAELLKKVDKLEAAEAKELHKEKPEKIEPKKPEKKPEKKSENKKVGQAGAKRLPDKKKKKKK